MGLTTFEGHESGTDRLQVYLYCNTAGRILGDAFESVEDAEQFAEWMDHEFGIADVRRLSAYSDDTIEAFQDDWRNILQAERERQDGEIWLRTGLWAQKWAAQLGWATGYDSESGLHWVRRAIAAAEADQ